MNTVYPSDYEDAEKIIEWAIELPDEVCHENEYMFNLRAIARWGCVDEGHFGYTVSMPMTYRRAMSKKYTKENSDYLPHKKGERIDIGEVRVLFVKGVQTQYGVSYLYKMITTADENLVTWFSSREITIDDNPVNGGDVIQLKGTIKKFQEYKGVKETLVNRCKMSIAE